MHFDSFARRMNFDPELMKSVRRVPDVRGVVCGNEMARNSEKRLTGLNRFLEAKESLKKADLQRPPLHQLSSADEIKGWIPSIQKEINHLLKQTEGTGSRKPQDSTIKEFQERIEYLEREHKRFVAKVRSLDPSYRDVVPWQPRAYSRKRGRDPEGGGGRGSVCVPHAKKLFSPLLQGEKSVASSGLQLPVPTQDPDPELQGFSPGSHGIAPAPCGDAGSTGLMHSHNSKELGNSPTPTNPWPPAPEPSTNQTDRTTCSSETAACWEVEQTAGPERTAVLSHVYTLAAEQNSEVTGLKCSRGLLGLDYSSSSSSEDN